MCALQGWPAGLSEGDRHAQGLGRAQPFRSPPGGRRRISSGSGRAQARRRTQRSGRRRQAWGWVQWLPAHRRAGGLRLPPHLPRRYHRHHRQGLPPPAPATNHCTGLQHWPWQQPAACLHPGARPAVHARGVLNQPAAPGSTPPAVGGSAHCDGRMESNAAQEVPGSLAVLRVGRHVLEELHPSRMRSAAN